MEANESNTQDFQETPLPQRLAATAMLAYGIWLAMKTLVPLGVSIGIIFGKVSSSGYPALIFFIALNATAAILLWWKSDAIAAWCFPRQTETQQQSGGMILLEAAMPVLGVVLLAATFMTLSSLVNYLNSEMVRNLLKSRPPAFEILLVVTYNVLRITIGLMLMRFGASFAGRIYRFNAVSPSQPDSERSTQ